MIDTLVAEAARAAPAEACGLLLGSANLIEIAVPTRNIHLTPRTHFEIDPAMLIAAHKAARAGGPAVLGYYHSHPTGVAEPSATDRVMASGDGRMWGIVAGGEVRWWRDESNGFAKIIPEIDSSDNRFCRASNDHRIDAD